MIFPNLTSCHSFGLMCFVQIIHPHRILIACDWCTFELSLNVLELVNKASEIYKRRTPEEKQMLLKVLVSNATLKDKEIDATLRVPFNYIVEYNKTNNKSGIADSNPDRTLVVPEAYSFALQCRVYGAGRQPLGPRQPGYVLSEWWGSNPRPHRPKRCALPTALHSVRRSGQTPIDCSI